MTPEAQAVLYACHSLIREIETPGNLERPSLVLREIEKMLEVLPALQQAAEQLYLEQTEAEVAAAAGAAATHDWAVDGAAGAECGRRCISAVAYLLPRGAVPVCGEQGDCAPWSSGHSLYGRPGGGSYCAYCKTEYPVTATEPAEEIR
jgi:hypothetical protein